MTAHIGIVAGTEQLRDGDGKPIAHTDHKPENEIVHRTGGPHRRQCANTNKSAHNNGIRQAVKLLKQIAQHQRQCKKQDYL